MYVCIGIIEREKEKEREDIKGRMIEDLQIKKSMREKD